MVDTAYHSWTNFAAVDVASTMVEEHNRRARSQGLSPNQMHAIEGDLMTTLEESPGCGYWQ